MVGGGHGHAVGLSMGKRNKIRYQSKDKPKITLALSGNVYLLHVDDESLAAPAKGDLKVYAITDALNGPNIGDYESTGASGYFKADVYDGREWRLALLASVFAHKENHFAKRERPIDTYGLCAEILAGMAGQLLVRTYREHYELDTD